jgi:hypothetical protein
VSTLGTKNQNPKSLKTLNQVLGMTYHFSPLRKKLNRLGLSDPKEWQTLAVQRGCTHYPTVTKPVQDPGLEHLSNEELGLALLLGELPYDPQAIRVSAQLLSGEIDVGKLLFVAKRERLECLLNRIASDILSFGINHSNWPKILDSTNSREFPEAVLPHPTRYVVDQGNYVPHNQRFKILQAS